MRTVHAALAAALLCAPAFADDEKGGKPAPAPDPEKQGSRPEAKMERKADPAADKLFERYAGLVSYPATMGVKAISAKGEVDLMGTAVGIDPKWSLEKGFDLELRLPEPMREQAEHLTPVVMQQVYMIGTNAPFDLPAKSREDYDVVLRTEGDDQVVEMTPFTQKADAKRRVYVFGKDGLLKRSSMEPRPDPRIPDGLVFDVEWRFERKGERHLLVARKLAIQALGQEAETKFTYYEGPNRTYFLKDVTVSSPGQGEQVIRFHDYTVDGKLLECTKSEPKAEQNPASDRVPQEKPAAPPPAPGPGK